jgi:hypothetical protein
MHKDTQRSAYGEQTPDPPAENRPAGHSTARADVDPSGQAYPGAHTPLHAADGSPSAFPYTPGGQEAHTPGDTVYLRKIDMAVRVGLIDKGGGTRNTVQPRGAGASTGTWPHSLRTLLAPTGQATKRAYRRMVHAGAVGVRFHTAHNA